MRLMQVTRGEEVCACAPLTGKKVATRSEIVDTSAAREFFIGHNYKFARNALRVDHFLLEKRTNATFDGSI
jgi:hypothetical protein